MKEIGPPAALSGVEPKDCPSFESLSRFEKGTMEIINDNPKSYVFSNVFEVASKSRPYEKITVGRNLKYVIKAIRAENTSA